MSRSSSSSRVRRARPDDAPALAPLYRDEIECQQRLARCFELRAGYCD